MKSTVIERGHRQRIAAYQKSLAVVVPCFNEVDGMEILRDRLMRLRAALEGKYRVELVLVDDASTDATELAMRDCFDDQDNVTIVRHETNQGIAAAIRTGLRHTEAEIVASLDADCTYDPLELVPMVHMLHDDVDLVLASPYHPEGGVEGVPAWRLRLSKVASHLYRLVLRNKLHTYTSCVRVYRRSSVVDLPLRHGGFAGVVELVWQLDRHGGTIHEHPAVLTSRRTGHSKMRVANVTLCHLRLLSKAAWLRMFGVRPAPISRHSPVHS